MPGTEQGRISPVKEVPSNSSPCKDFSARSRNAVLLRANDRLEDLFIK